MHVVSIPKTQEWREGTMRVIASKEKAQREKDVYDRFDKALPKKLRKVILELENNPLWMEIGDHLVSIPVRQEVDRMRLIDELSMITKEDYFEIRRALRDLEEKGYIYVKKGSKPDNFLTPPFAEAIKFKKKFDKDVVDPIVAELRSDPEFSSCKNLDKSLRRAIYSALK